MSTVDEPQSETDIVENEAVPEHAGEKVAQKEKEERDVKIEKKGIEKERATEATTKARKPFEFRKRLWHEPLDGPDLPHYNRLHKMPYDAVQEAFREEGKGAK